MRRFVSAFLLLALLLALTGCGAPAPRGEEKLLVVASAFPSYDLVRAVAGDLVELKLLLKPGAEPHSYEPSPQDILAVEQCDLFLYGGGESDVWLDRVLSSGGSAQRRVIRLMDCAEVCTAEHDHEAHEHDHEEAYDEHVWTSPMNALRIMEAIVEQLAELDGAHADVYRENARLWEEKLLELDGEFRSVAAEGRRKLLVFGDRFPFLYFTREYGLEYLSAYPGCSDAAEVDPATLAELIDRVEELEIPIVFRCDLSAGKVADTISEATGARVETLYSCHTLSKADFEAGESYLSLMTRNLNVIREALN